MDIQTADLCDAHDSTLQVLTPMFRSFGRRTCFGGPIATVKVFEDNSLVRSTLETQGNGRVLVVDGGGSLRCALVGDQLALLGFKNGWAGILVNGCVRDSVAIGQMDIGVMAIATNPRKSVKRGLGEQEVVVGFGDVTFTPGHHVYADPDGVVVSPVPLV